MNKQPDYLVKDVQSHEKDKCQDFNFQITFLVNF